MLNAGLYLEEATVIYGFYLLAARLPELAVNVVKTRRLAHGNTGAIFQHIYYSIPSAIVVSLH